MRTTPRRRALRAVLSLALAGLALVPLAAPASAASGVGRDDPGISTPADEEIVIDVLANDVGIRDTDNVDPVSTSALGSQVWVDAGKVHFYASAVGADSFTYKVRDPDGVVRGSAKVSVTVTKARVVSARDDSYDVEQGIANPLDVTENDTTGPAGVTMTLVTGPQHGTATVNPDPDRPTLTYTPSDGYAGPDTLTYRLTDPAGHKDSGVVSLAVEQVGVRDLEVSRTWDGAHLTWRNPRSPDFRGLQVRLAEAAPGDDVAAPGLGDGTVVDVAADATSLDLTHLSNLQDYAVSVFATYAGDAVSDPESRFFHPGVEPVSDLHADAGNAQVTLAWTDPPAGLDSVRIAWTTPAGAARSATVSGPTSTTVTGLTNGHAYTFTATTVPDGAGGDGDERSVDATPRTRTNHAPTAAPDVVSVAGADPVSFDVTGNDADADVDAPRVLSHTAPAHGTLDCRDDGHCTYTPESDTSPSDGFSYTLSDGYGGRSTTTVELVRRDVTLRSSMLRATTIGSTTLDVLANHLGRVLPDDVLSVDESRTPYGRVESTTDDAGLQVLQLTPNGVTGTLDLGYTLTDTFGHLLGHAVATVHVLQTPLVTLRADRPAAGVDVPIQLSGRAGPVDVDQLVNLERFTNGSWNLVTSAQFATGSTSAQPGAGAPYSFEVSEVRSGYPRYRVVVPEANGRSESITELEPLDIYTAGLGAVRKTGNESVVLANTGKTVIGLKSWTITTLAGKKLTLPTRALQPGASVKVHPGTGRTTRTDIYLRRGASFGNTHDRLRLRDANHTWLATATY